MAEEKWVPNKFVMEENICTRKFIKFSQLPKMQKYFAVTAETQYGTMCDTVNENKTGGTVVVELKDRERNAADYEDCYIEPYKYDNLMKLYDKGCLPFYLNFIGNKYYLWILPSIPEDRITLHKGVAIKSAISGYKHVDRYGLNWQDAWIFDKEGNVVQRSACEKNIPTPPKAHNIDFDKEINNEVLNNL